MSTSLRRRRPVYRRPIGREQESGRLGSPGAADACLLHLSGSLSPIRGTMHTAPSKRFVPLHAQDLQPVECALALGDRPIAAIERLTPAGRRTHHLTPVLALRVESGGGLALREMVIVR